MPEPPSKNDERTRGHTSASQTEEATIEGPSHSWEDPGADASDLPTGASLGRYTILRRLGSGAMGVVYSAFDPDLDRKVAIKILHPRTEAVGSGEEGKLRLLREAKALARLSHPNVVAIHDVGTFGDRIFLAMEFVDGETLGAWLKKRRRPWRESVAVLIKAGEGLAGAHRGGLVHRDFKPENVVLGHDGRVRVLDFGLARASDDIELHSTPGLSLESSASISVDITSTGVLVGTPAYMSPEQHIGRPADARSDIFSFCVTLYLALYGERPYEGENLSVLASNVIQGKIRPPKPGAKVPTWLRKLVLQGLCIDPEDRFPSMAVLLERLRHDPVRIRMRWLGVVAVPALLIGIGVGTLQGQPEAPCQGAVDRLEGIWDDARRAAIEGAFMATGVPYAANALESTSNALDRYGAQWVEMYTESCEATQVRKEQSAEMLDLQMLCLDRHLRELEALTDVFAEPSPVVVQNALQGVVRLPDVASCGDRHALRETVPPPSDPETRKLVGRIRGSLAEAKAQDVAGQWGRALEQAEEALDNAKAVGYAPLEADALLLIASLQQQTGAHEEAMNSLQKAGELAAASRYDEAVAHAWIESVYVAGIRQACLPQALWSGRAAEIAIRRVEGRAGDGGGPRTLLRARLDLNLARVLQRLSDPNAAERAARALEVFEDKLGEDHPLVHHALTVLALAAMDLKEYQEAENYLVRARTIASRVSGPDHPSVAAVLNNLAQVWVLRKEPKEALKLARLALEIRERVLAPDHADIATSLERNGSIESLLGRGEPAAEHFARALEIYDREPTANAPNRGSCLNSLALLDLDRGDSAAAKEHFRQAIEALTIAFGDEHEHTATAKMNLGEIMIDDGEVEAGLLLVESAVGFFREDESLSDLLAFALTVAGGSLLESGELRLAEVRLREALTIYGKTNKVDPTDVATTRFAMARTILAMGRDRQAALALAERALEGLEAEHPLKVEIEAWLAAQT